MYLNCKGLPAVKINAKLVVRGKKSNLYYCEGDEVWIPNSLCQYDDKNKELLIQEWKYEQMVEDGEL